MNSKRNIAIVGAGLVGSMLSIYLRKRGYQVTVYERRADLRIKSAYAGRSINLALSARGLTALEEIGLTDKISEIVIPMHGRMVHDLEGRTNFQAYGKQGQYINSISRSDLNIELINAAEVLGVNILFNHKFVNVDFENTKLTTLNYTAAKNQTISYDIIIGADGAYSSVRGEMQITDRFNYAQQYIEHGYKELHIPATASKGYQLEKNALHIWPRESFMMIALPNIDGSFTCTLFFPYEGPTSFENLKSTSDIEGFFKETFPDAFDIMPSLLQDFNNNPISSLVTITCSPWKKGKVFLIGDAAHALVPFYGQGMNAGFEDCSVLNSLLTKHDDNWDEALLEFQALRKPDTVAIAQLALDNFIEMRDLVADPEFILRKKIEAKLHSLYPDRWIPLYAMVTFNPGIRYSEAYTIGKIQKRLMDDILKIPEIATTWQALNFEEIVDQLTHSLIDAKK